MIVHQRVYKNRGLKRKVFGNKEVGELRLPSQPYHGVLIPTLSTRKCSAQARPPPDHRTEMLTERIEPARGKGLKTTPVPVVGAGKRTADESAGMSSRLRQINAAQDTFFSVTASAADGCVKCRKSPSVTPCTR